MFDKNKMQIEILKAMLDKNKHVRKINIDGRMALTLDGFSAYIFDEKDLLVDVSNVAVTTTIKFDSSKKVEVSDTMIRKIENKKQSLSFQAQMVNYLYMLTDSFYQGFRDVRIMPQVH